MVTSNFWAGLLHAAHELEASYRHVTRTSGTLHGTRALSVRALLYQGIFDLSPRHLTSSVMDESMTTSSAGRKKLCQVSQLIVAPYSKNVSAASAKRVVSMYTRSMSTVATLMLDAEFLRRQA